MRVCILALHVVISATLVPSIWRSATAEDQLVRFNQDIRPILSENCYHCHGPDTETRKAGLRLDTEEGAKESAIVERDAAASEMLARMLSEDDDERMPPPDSERSVTPQQIDLVRRWINQGASYEGHWSFVTPQPPKLPNQVEDAKAIDHFVGKRLNQKELEPAEEADRETLIRRVTFDLTGLPPTIQEIDEFLDDESDDAYETLVDRLLARESFGERMASDWLDAARYSDTYGFQVDRDRFVWPWRDWVVRAFNQNLPYDQFITHQLAGDLLPNATRDQILATTFNRLHPQKVEGGSVPEEFRIEYVADRTQTVATAIMGLTYECCRCHNHKYDPLSQEEYYQLAAFFDNIDEAGLYSYFTPSIPTPTLTLPTPAQAQQLKQQIATVLEKESIYQDLVARTAQAIEGDREQKTRREMQQAVTDTYAQAVATVDFDEAPNGANEQVEGVQGGAFKLSGDDAVGTKVGNFARSQPFSVSLWINTPDIKERAVLFHRSRAWTDAASRGYQLLLEDGKLSWSLIHFWPGNAIRVRGRERIPTNQWMHVTVTNDGSSRAAGLRIFVDGKAIETNVVRDGLTKQITGGGGDNIAIGERFRDRGFKHGLVDRMHIFDVELTELEIERLAQRGESIDWLEGEDWTDAQENRVRQHLMIRTGAKLKDARQSLFESRSAKCKTEDALSEIMVMRELPQRRPSYLLLRGAYDQRGQSVLPGTPEALIPFPTELPKNRLGLAQWLIAPEHPLTSRVAVNRLWQLCFGRGLVRTPEDFGSQGEPPTHPELLDWLAIEMINSGWDIKHMLKLIVMSDTYRRSSRHRDPAIVDADPTNLWLAVFPSYRLPAEMLRDNALAISGRLVSKIGGPPVKPYEVEASFKPSTPDKGEGLYRRSLYTYWKRTGPAPVMMALDAAKRDVCRVQRERTSSPLQAFVMLNGPQYVEAARGLAERLMKTSPANDGDSENSQTQIETAFRVLTSRRPSREEVDVLHNMYGQQLEYFTGSDKKTQSFLAVGDAPADDSLDQSKLAALSVVVGTLMNFDESMMKR